MTEQKKTVELDQHIDDLARSSAKTRPLSLEGAGKNQQKPERPKIPFDPEHPLFSEPLQLEDVLQKYVNPKDMTDVVPKAISEIVAHYWTRAEFEFGLARSPIFASQISGMNQEFAINLLMRTFRGTPATPAELQAYMPHIKDRVFTTKLLREISKNPFFQEGLLHQLYGEVTGREPTAETLAPYVEQIRTGDDILVVAKDVKRCPEARSAGNKRRVILYDNTPVAYLAIMR